MGPIKWSWLSHPPRQATRGWAQRRLLFLIKPQWFSCATLSCCGLEVSEGRSSLSHTAGRAWGPEKGSGTSSRERASRIVCGSQTGGSRLRHPLGFPALGLVLSFPEGRRHCQPRVKGVSRAMASFQPCPRPDGSRAGSRDHEEEQGDAWMAMEDAVGQGLCPTLGC